jgi:hypothetical protein
MKYFLFKRESDDFTDILTDTNIKKNIKTRIKFLDHLIVGIPNDKNLDKVSSYIILKYGEDMRDFKNVIPDRSPVMYKDYWPKDKHKTS